MAKSSASCSNGAGNCAASSNPKTSISTFWYLMFYVVDQRWVSCERREQGRARRDLDQMQQHPVHSWEQLIVYSLIINHLWIISIDKSARPNARPSCNRTQLSSSRTNCWSKSWTNSKPCIPTTRKKRQFTRRSCYQTAAILRYCKCNTNVSSSWRRSCNCSRISTTKCSRVGGQINSQNSLSSASSTRGNSNRVKTSIKGRWPSWKNGSWSRMPVSWCNRKGPSRRLWWDRSRNHR